MILGTESFPRAAYPSWRPVEQFPYVIGDFVWTGMDHLGESSIGNAQLNVPGRAPGAAGAGAPSGATAAQGPPAPGTFGAMMAGGSSSISLPFPWFNCYCGDIDLIGQAKAQWFHRRVIWGLSTLEMAVQRPLPAGRTEVISPWGWSDELRSWTWPGNEGKTLKVRVYSSGDQVRLLLNGKEVGIKPVSPDTELRAEFEVPYAPGELKAIAHLGGTPDRGTLVQDRGKAGEIAADGGSRLDPEGPERPVLRDRRGRRPGGRLVPDAVIPVSLSVSGAAELGGGGIGESEGRRELPQPASEDVPWPVPRHREANGRRRSRDGAGAGRRSDGSQHRVADQLAPAGERKV